MDLRKSILVALLVGFVGLGGIAIGSGMKGCNGPWPTPTPSPTPSPVHNAKVQAIAATLKANPTKAHKLGAFYGQLADKLPGFKTVLDFEVAHRAGLIALKADDPPMVGIDIDAMLGEVIGLNTDDPIDPKRTEFTALIKDLSAALLEVK